LSDGQTPNKPEDAEANGREDKEGKNNKRPRTDDLNLPEGI